MPEDPDAGLANAKANANAKAQGGPEAGEDAMVSVESLIADNQLDAAASLLQSRLIANPTDSETIFRLANLWASQGRIRDAIEVLEGIPLDDPRGGLAALGQSADYAMMLEDFDGARTRYEKILSVAPGANLAVRNLAYLYNRMGRRYDAARLIRQLCRAGDVREDELHSLISVPDAMFDLPERLETMVEGDRHYLPIGLTGQARIDYSNDDLLGASQKLRAHLESRPDSASSIWAFYGRVVAEMQDDDSIAWWLKEQPAGLERQAEYWAAIGAIAIDQKDFSQAIGCLWKAYLNEPSDANSVRRLHQAFLSIAEIAPSKISDDVVSAEEAREAAEVWEERFQALKQLKREAQKVDQVALTEPAVFSSIAQRLAQLNRPLESLMWQATGVLYQQDTSDTQRREWISDLNQSRLALVAAKQSFPMASLSIQPLRERFPVDPSVPISIAIGRGVRDRESPESRVIETVQPATWVNVGPEMGLDHTYQPATETLTAGFAMHQQLGGGVAVMDFDQDGMPDLYLAQAASDPPEFKTTQPNAMFRNLGHRLVPVAALAGTDDLGFGTGVSAGDWNQDGFDDLVLANVGDDALFLNNGDGTFRRVPLPDSRGTPAIDSSMAIADVTGDGLMDIVAISYVDDSTAFARPPVNKNGQVDKSLGPSLFQPAKDRIWVGDPIGGLVEHDLSTDPRAASPGLGVVITASSVPGRNDIFVGNDGAPNQYWTPDPEVTTAAGEPPSRSPDVDAGEISSDRPLGFINSAAAIGCAFGRDGTPTASMGIAAADFDDNGQLDYFITNFSGESNNLFLQDGFGYRDRHQAFGLSDSGRGLVGFGAHPIDFDNNGLIDIAITNGHVDSISTDEAPLRQPFQLLGYDGSTFSQVEYSSDDSYVNREHRGRAMAVLDLEGDGDLDLAITHLFEPTAILRNETVNQGNHLQVECVGTRSPRCPVGTRVQVITNQKTQTAWVNAGDGYECKNQGILHFGLGNARPESIEVRWPDGREETYEVPEGANRLLFVESPGPANSGTNGTGLADSGANGTETDRQEVWIRW